MNKDKLSRKMLGTIGENLAFNHLQEMNWRMLERNWRCRTGEIDIIAMDGETLVIIEVRTRSSTSFGTPQESIHALKQNKVRETAQVYANRYKLLHLQQRFDVVSIVTDKEGRLQTLEHLSNAF
jgi:putative endonuclease